MDECDSVTLPVVGPTAYGVCSDIGVNRQSDPVAVSTRVHVEVCGLSQDGEDWIQTMLNALRN